MRSGFRRRHFFRAHANGHPYRTLHDLGRLLQHSAVPILQRRALEERETEGIRLIQQQGQCGYSGQ